MRGRRGARYRRRPRIPPRTRRPSSPGFAARTIACGWSATFSSPTKLNHYRAGTAGEPASSSSTHWPPTQRLSVPRRRQLIGSNACRARGTLFAVAKLLRERDLNLKNHWISGESRLMTDLVWLWVVYRVDSDAVFGAVRRAEILYRTAEEARSVVGQVADRMGADEIRWDQTDEATWVARTTRYVCVVWSIRLPE